MKEYLLLFRSPLNANNQPPSREEMAASMEQWNKWMSDIGEKFVSGQPLSPDGKLMKTKTSVTDAPFAEGKEVLSGFFLVKAAGYDDAVELSKGCPIFESGGSVEVREIAIMDM
jgi:hypothetical protein